MRPPESSVSVYNDKPVLPVQIEAIEAQILNGANGSQTTTNNFAKIKDGRGKPRLSGNLTDGNT